MTSDQILIAVTRLETVASRFEALADKVDGIDTRLTKEESTSVKWPQLIKWGGSIAATVIAGVIVLILKLK